ncbi:hypothetical protein Jiend_18390 [Micromonospora endophytica]|nr:hypothetical protein Jiend_18390 [Micromonospora endophytica]
MSPELLGEWPDGEGQHPLEVRVVLGKVARSGAGADHTGAASRSARAIAAGQAPARSTAAPSTSAGVRLLARVAANRCSRSGSGANRVDTVRAAGGGSAGCAQSSSGRERKAGPAGGWTAVAYARINAAGTSCALTGSCAHLTYGWGSSVGWRAASRGSSSSISRVCWPAVMISGVRLCQAVTMLPMALPVPGAVCRLTCAGLPVAWAYPSAMPTADASWSASTYRKSSGNAWRNGSSVEPGLPKTVVMPSERSRS